MILELGSCSRNASVLTNKPHAQFGILSNLEDAMYVKSKRIFWNKQDKAKWMLSCNILEIQWTGN